MDDPRPDSGPDPSRSMHIGTSSNCGSGIKRDSERPGLSWESVRSDRSKDLDPNFNADLPEDLRDSERPGLSWESVRSDRSKDLDPNFNADLPEDLRCGAGVGGVWGVHQLDAIFTRLEEHIVTFVKEQLLMFYRLLVTEYPESSFESEEEQNSREAVLNITLDFLRRMNQEQVAESLMSRSTASLCSGKLRKRLQQKFSQVFEGVAKSGNPAPLRQIYTELYITEGGASEINQKHEVRHMETMSRRAGRPERVIKCEDIFKQCTSSELPIRTVLTKGVAGVGKTVLTQKFIMDWAEGKANQDIQLLLPFTFRELNVFSDTEFSLVGLVHHFFSETKGLCSFEDLQLLFIFDGLDECRLPLDFSRTRVLTEPTESVSLDALLVNLIRGSLLPSAHLWITTRPAAASQIPAECVFMVTEVQGFSNLQKEEYFMKRFRDEQEATAVISHIKTIYSLYIMCYIPIFCWIISAVIQKLLEQTEGPELPKTLTEMYIHFLVVQAKVKNIKYYGQSGADFQWTPETREMVQSLGKLAYEQLEKGNLIFYESDLTECGLDAAAASVYSGVFTEVFREESGLYQDKVYCFVHLSVQEFLAALHVHQTFYSSGLNLLSTSHSSEHPDPEAFYCSAVERASQSPNGHLDLFLRFLLGLSLPTNHTLLQGLLTHTGSSSQTNQETIEYIKDKLNEETVSIERSLNLFYCLYELNDHSLVEHIQRTMRGGGLSDKIMSPAEWSAVVFLLLSSDSDLEEFDLINYQASEEALFGLLPVVNASTKAILSGCGLSSLSCGPLASILSSSSLTYLDLSNNNLKDSGVEQLCKGLERAPCRLETLRLSGCLVSKRGGASLTSALSSSLCHLRELDVSYNNLESSNMDLMALQMNPQHPLKSLRLFPAGMCWMVPGLRKYYCEFSLDPNTAQRELVLSVDKCSVTCVEQQQVYPDHEDRFTVNRQVLSSTGLWGRCYWEVEWRGIGAVIGVGYKRKELGVEYAFGDNDQSWSLRIYNGQYAVHHNNMLSQLSTQHSHSSISSGYVGMRKTRSPKYKSMWSRRMAVWPGRVDESSDEVNVPSGRVCVFLDTEGGCLSFYRFSLHKLIHLYTFCASFTEPLFPGFALSLGSTVSLGKRRHLEEEQCP